MNIPDSSTYTSTIKRGHYGLLDAQVKLGILKELVNQALESDAVRDKLDEYIEERQVLGATRRGEALEVARKTREEKEQLKAESVANGGTNAQDPLADNLDVLAMGIKVVMMES
uniref:WHIM1 domain-containing protein n=1 Tax=Rhizophora mucronata TaxID=61149 RepID=A0A2P2Q8A9_RHIMU